MAQNIIFIITEGDHDCAFIYRILKANGMSTYHNIPIKNYPSPLNELFKSGVGSTPIEDLGIENTKSPFLPNRVMKKDDAIVAIYAMTGDGQKEKRKNLIKKLDDFRIADPDAIQAIDNETKLTILFFFDADDKGTDFRIKQINDEINEIFAYIEEKEEISNNNIILIDDIRIGAFIFTELKKDTGKLEDILIPLMQYGNDDIFNAACQFLDLHESCALFKGKVKYDSTDTKIKKKINGQKYDFKKSLIGTVGQLQKSGKSNTVCITDADYLDDGKIKSNHTCNDIWNFIGKVL